MAPKHDLTCLLVWGVFVFIIASHLSALTFTPSLHKVIPKTSFHFALMYTI